MNRHLNILHRLGIEVVEWVRVDTNGTLRRAKEYHSILDGNADAREKRGRGVMFEGKILTLIGVHSNLVIGTRSHDQIEVAVVGDCVVLVGLLGVIHVTLTIL